MLNVYRGLADTDADGKMDINEFSIACKLIYLKLKGFDIPLTLPPSMLSSVKPVGKSMLMNIFKRFSFPNIFMNNCMYNNPCEWYELYLLVIIYVCV